MRLLRPLAFVLSLCAFATLTAGLAVLAYTRGWIWCPPDARRFPVWGVDVSHHQGSIDWRAVAAGGRIRFAYLKATEGDHFTDSQFERNWREARAQGLRVGAYHFFSFCTPGADQALHFLSVAHLDPEALPPALDVEADGACARPPPRDALVREIAAWSRAVEAATGKRPIVYVTGESYRTLIAGSSLENPLWIRDLLHEPDPPGGEAWTFWQFHSRGRIQGVSRPVDLNVYRSELGPLEAQ